MRLENAPEKPADHSFAFFGLHGLGGLFRKACTACGDLGFSLRSGFFGMKQDHITDDHRIGFGAIVNAFADVEATLELMILRLIGADPVHVGNSSTAVLMIRE